MRHLLLFLAAVLYLTTAVAQTNFTVDKITYEITDDVALNVQVAGSTASNEPIAIPATVTYNDCNYHVTAIAGNAFQSKTITGELNIPSSVRSIGDRAFQDCKYLTAISIPSSVESIGINAFYRCYAVESLSLDCESTYGDNCFQRLGYEADKLKVSIGKNVQTIPEMLFRSLKITELTFAPEGKLREIGASAFSGCKISGAINFPPTLTTIGESAFANCSNLASISIPHSINVLGAGAFSGCSGLTELYMNAQYESITSKRSTRPFANIGTSGQPLAVVIGKDVESLEAYFCNGSYLTSLAFEQGSKLREIGESAFSGTTLTGEVALPEGLQTIGNSAFYETDIKTLTIPESVTTIGGSAFLGNKDIQTLYWNTGNPSVETPVFGGIREAMSGTDLYIGKKVQIIPDYLFGGYEGSCDMIKSLHWPETCNVQTIGERAFQNNPRITTPLEVPASVKKIGDYAFAYTGIVSAKLPSSVEQLGREVLQGCSELRYLYYDVAYGEAQFPNASEYGIDNLEIHFGPNVRNIAEDFFFNAQSSNVKVFFNEATALEKIGKQAFFSNELAVFDSFEFPNTLTEIGENAFAGCKSATVSVVLPESLVTLGYNAFSGVTATSFFYGTENAAGDMYPQFEGLKIDGPVTIGKNVKTLKKELFKGHHVTNVSFEAESILDKIEEACFHDVGLGGQLVLPSKLRTIGERAFYEAQITGELILPESLDSIGSRAFQGCSEIKSELKIPAALTTIGDYTFQGCAGLTGTLTIPAGINKVGWNAFGQCGFTKLVIEDSSEPIEFGNNFDPTGSWIIKAPSRVVSMSGIALPEGQFSNMSEVVIGRNITYLCGAVMDMGIARHYYSPFNGFTRYDKVTLRGNCDKLLPYMFARLDDETEESKSSRASVVAQISEIALFSPTPPEVEETSFGNMEKSECTLSVPEDAISLYKGTAVWRDFYVRALTGIDNITAEDENSTAVTRYYDLQGVQVSNPTTGIYIRVRGNKAEKVLVK